MSGWSIIPRQQSLLPLKQFASNARWGSVTKFQLVNENLSPNHKTGKCKETTSSVIDDIHGASNISEHFKQL